MRVRFRKIARLEGEKRGTRGEARWDNRGSDRNVAHGEIWDVLADISDPVFDLEISISAGGGDDEGGGGRGREEEEGEEEEAQEGEEGGGGHGASRGNWK